MGASKYIWVLARGMLAKQTRCPSRYGC